MSRSKPKQPRPAETFPRENIDPELAADFGEIANGPIGVAVAGRVGPEQGCSCKPGALDLANDSNTLCSCCASMPVHRRCPCCWGTNRGVGVAYATALGKSYYRCHHSLVVGGGRCNMTWTARVTFETKTVRVEHRNIEPERRE